MILGEGFVLYFIINLFCFFLCSAELFGFSLLKWKDFILQMCQKKGTKIVTGAECVKNFLQFFFGNSAQKMTSNPPSVWVNVKHLEH